MYVPSDFKAAVEKIEKLNPAAAVFARAHQLIRNPNAQLEEISNIIKMDSALTADIIRLSNSAALGAAQPTGNLQVAIGRVGLKAVDRYLGLSISKTLMNRNLESYGISAYDYWSNSVSMAIMMELLARRLRQDPNEAYTLGILHAVGRLIIDQVLEEMGISVHWDTTEPIVQWETKMVGFNYTTAGAVLLTAWGFPSDIPAAIECQLAPGKLVEPSIMVKLLNFSLRLCLMAGDSFSRTENLPVSDPFMIEFQIGAQEVRDMVSIAAIMLEEAKQTLGIMS